MEAYGQGLPTLLAAQTVYKLTAEVVVIKDAVNVGTPGRPSRRAAPTVTSQGFSERRVTTKDEGRFP